MLAQSRVIAKGRRIRDFGGECFEYHWYEHSGIGRVELKRKQVKES
jgi:hypothetical protein